MPKWEVVGGADKGGILVREGQAGTSAQAAERLSTGAVVEQLELIGDRLHYQLVTGTGPAEGWVSIKITGKELLVPLEEDAAPLDPADWPSRLSAALSAAPVAGTLKDAAPWIGSVGKAPAAARVRLVVCSWTGNRGGAGSAHNFTKWPKWLSEWAGPDVFQVVEVKYPGRGTRMKEPNATTAQEIAAGAVDSIKKAGGPTANVLFGFSFGAIIAYEIAQLLCKKGRAPLGLVVASAEHPHWADRGKGVGTDGGPTKDTPDTFFEWVLRDKGGTDFILDGAPEMKKMYLPVIRADMIMEEAYGVAPPEHLPLPCPILCFHGQADPIIKRHDMEPWVEYFTGCKEGTPSRVEDIEAGLPPTDDNPWLCDWYLCQGEGSAGHMVWAIASTFGGAQG